jgi:hypothetical protein
VADWDGRGQRWFKVYSRCLKSRIRI